MPASHDDSRDSGQGSRGIARILSLLSAQLNEQRARGSAYLVGDRLSALDVHWATFCAILSPLPDEVCPMQGFMRAQYTVRDPVILDALDPGLLEHRDSIYQQHLELPLDF